MRIVSLVPHATELLYALGLGDSVVGVTHECDYPPATAALPRITRDVLPAGLSAAEIDAAVRERTEKGEAIYLLDEEKLAELEPDLIVTQELCPVCAVSYEEVRDVAKKLDPCPTVIALDPKTFGETMGDIRTLAQATDARDAALDLVARQRARVDRVRIALKGARRRRVIAIEWFDPVFIAGHWTPQLIDMAGGTDLLGFAGEHSEQLDVGAAGGRQARGRGLHPLRLRRPARAGRGRAVRRPPARAGRQGGRRARRRRLLQPPGPAAGRRPGDAGPRAASRPGPRGARARVHRVMLLGARADG